MYFKDSLSFMECYFPDKLRVIDKDPFSQNEGHINEESRARVGRWSMVNYDGDIETVSTNLSIPVDDKTRRDTIQAYR
jgi:hypothetical protein